MKNIVYFLGVKATVQQIKFKFMALAVLAVASLGVISCGPAAGPAPNNGSGAQSDAPTGNAATVNGKPITLAEVERVAKQQAGDQWGKLSPLELAQARLQVLQSQIQTEVMYQKAEAEKTLPSEDDITTAFNNLKAQSGKSAEAFQKAMEEQGETEATVREGLKKKLAIEKLMEKVTGKVDAPKDAEIEAFFKGNPDAFIKKKGVRLSAIVVDPRKTSETDTTVDDASTKLKLNEIGTKLGQGVDFATVAREASEDQTAQQGGDMGYFTEEQLKQMYGGQLVGLMNPQIPIGKVVPVNLEGRFYYLKLVERSDKDEARTLETPGVREEISTALTNGRKALVSQAYAAQAMNEAKIDNFLLKQIIENPNNLSGARPAVTPDANANTNTNSNSVGSDSNINSKANANGNVKPASNANAEAKPAANMAANTANANK